MPHRSRPSAAGVRLSARRTPMRRWRSRGSMPRGRRLLGRDGVLRPVVVDEQRAAAWRRRVRARRRGTPRRAARRRRRSMMVGPLLERRGQLVGAAVGWTCRRRGATVRRATASSAGRRRATPPMVAGRDRRLRRASTVGSSRLGSRASRRSNRSRLISGRDLIGDRSTGPSSAATSSEHSSATSKPDQTDLAAQLEAGLARDPVAHELHQRVHIVGRAAVVGLDEVGVLVGHVAPTRRAVPRSPSDRSARRRSPRPAPG